MPGSTDKPKRKSSEKRKAKSRDAARTRRSNEAEIFADLTNEIPLSADTLAHCDKASLIRLIISQLRLKSFISSVLKCNLAPLHDMDSLLLEALDGFVMILTSTGDLVFVTENVLNVLGVAQVDMLGQKVYEFIHPCDHESIRNEISVRSDHDEVFFIRMRSSYNIKSHSFSVRAPDYKVVSCTAQSIIVRQPANGSPMIDMCARGSRVDHGHVGKRFAPNSNTVLYTVIIGRLILEPETRAYVPLDCRSFATRHSLSMKCVYCDDRVYALLGYRPEEIVGRSIYDYHHPSDDDLIKKTYKMLFRNGQMVIPFYRFLRKKGGYSWVETKAVMLGKPKQASQDQEVLCIHSIVSEPISSKILMSEVQRETAGRMLSTCSRSLPRFSSCDMDQHQNIRRINSDSRSYRLELEHPAAVVEEDDYVDSECMQFMTEEILGLAGINSGETLEKLIKPNCCEDILENVDDMYEMKAPYIPMDDDLIFDPVTLLKDITQLQPSYVQPRNDIRSTMNTFYNRPVEHRATNNLSSILRHEPNGQPKISSVQVESTCMNREQGFERFANRSDCLQRKSNFSPDSFCCNAALEACTNSPASSGCQLFNSPLFDDCLPRLDESMEKRSENDIMGPFISDDCCSRNPVGNFINKEVSDLHVSNKRISNKAQSLTLKSYDTSKLMDGGFKSTIDMSALQRSHNSIYPDNFTMRGMMSDRNPTLSAATEINGKNVDKHSIGCTCGCAEKVCQPTSSLNAVEEREDQMSSDEYDEDDDEFEAEDDGSIILKNLLMHGICASTGYRLKVEGAND